MEKNENLEAERSAKDSGDDGGEEKGKQTAQNADASTEAQRGQSEEQTDWKAKYLYLLAETENIKKRIQKERVELIETANESLLKNILPVLDNLFYAVKAVKDAESKLDEGLRNSSVFKNLSLGVEMTLKHFLSTLEQVGVKPIDAKGQEFNPAYHEALGESENRELANNVVAEELQKGFTLNGRVLRAARVMVNKIKN